MPSRFYHCAYATHQHANPRQYTGCVSQEPSLMDSCWEYACVTDSLLQNRHYQGYYRITVTVKVTEVKLGFAF